MNSVFVICEIEEGKVADVSLELLTKGRSLASTLQCKLEALVLGHQLNGIEKEIFQFLLRNLCFGLLPSVYRKNR